MDPRDPPVVATKCATSGETNRFVICITSGGRSLSETQDGFRGWESTKSPHRLMAAEITELVSELNRIASSVPMDQGAVLFHSGDPVSGVFIVRRGAVRMSLGIPSDLYPPRLLGPGEIAGLPATLTGHYSLTAEVAAPNAELGFVPGSRVSDLLEASPRLCFLAMRYISEEIARVRNALKEAPTPLS